MLYVKTMDGHRQVETPLIPLPVDADKDGGPQSLRRLLNSPLPAQQ